MARLEYFAGAKQLGEGTYELLITDSFYDENKNNVRVRFEIENGDYHTEWYSLNYDFGKLALSLLADAAFHMICTDGFDTDDLVGKYVIADIQGNEKNSFKNITNVKECDKAPKDIQPKFRKKQDTTSGIDDLPF